jgi:diaminopimelate decarboxylase
MIVLDLAHKKRQVARLLDEEHAYPTGRLDHVAEQILEVRSALLDLAATHPTPFYVFDEQGFAGALAAFAGAFGERIAGHRPFYAVKSNHHPLVVEGAVRAGFGLDVSSGRELAQALAGAPCPILFSGPAKSEADLALALDHADRTTVNLDSFRELERLGALAAQRDRTIRAGVRVFTDHHGAWSKFGIPLADLPRFWRAARPHPRVALEGIQFHLSWNRDARPYEAILADLGDVLSRGLTAEERAGIAFVDVGGGYRPHRLEGYFPGDHPLGALIQAADAHYGEESEFVDPYYLKPSIPLPEYAAAIGAAIDRHLRPLVSCAYYTEPGRVVSTFAMHILLRVVDKKSADLVIVDGGINMVGWERYLATYCPVVNLSRPAPHEIRVRIGGSLCDCEDLWGFHLYGEGVEEGDLLIVPFQGAYSFSTAQDFIRPIPPVYAL